MSMSIQVVSLKSPCFQEIRSLRKLYIGENPADEERYQEVENFRDSCSYHLAYLDGKKIVGAIRITPIGHGMSFVERMVDVRCYFEHPLDTFDANRLVLDGQYRGGKHLHNFLMQVSHWLMVNTNFRYISAVCRGNLASLYVAIGGQILAENLNWQSRESTRLYNLVSLDLEKVYYTIKGKMSNG